MISTYYQPVFPYFFINYDERDTLNFYQKGFSSTITENSFRYELMKPIEPMLNYLNTPLTSKNIGGYDSLMASEMLGIWTPKKDFSLIEEYIPLLKDTLVKP